MCPFVTARHLVFVVALIALLSNPVTRGSHPAGVANDSIFDMDLLNKRLGEQLSLISDLLKSKDETLAQDLQAFTAESVQCESLRPNEAAEVYSNRQLSVSRTPASFQSSQTYRGHNGFALALNELKEPLRPSEKIKVKFKTIRVSADGDFVDCRALVHIVGTSEQQVAEQSADWSMRWSFADQDRPLLLTIGVNEYEETLTHRGQGKWFADCTESMFADVPSFGPQIMKGTRDWRSELTAAVEVDFVGQLGVSVGDVDGDGREDVFLCQPNGLPNRLFRQRTDGTLQDVSAAAGVDFLDTTRSALLLDFDNDGDQDLVCAIPRHVLFLENDGKGVFALRASPVGPKRGYSLSAADYDQDGDLDVYACGYVRHDNFLANPVMSMLSVPTPYHDARNGGPNLLLKNDGDFKFVDATEESGLNHNNDRFTHAAVFEDFDNDGDPDLYVANDFGRNNLYRNENGKFKDVAAETGTEDIAASMGIAIEDFDKDGWMDIYISNMFSAAGNRTTNHHTFKSKSTDQVKSAFKRHARGNTLYRNSGGGVFEDVSQQAAVTLGRWAWSSSFIDMNNDGWHDLFVCNGYVTNERTQDL